MQRVLLVGSHRLDTVADSYRRTLTGHYEVHSVNPHELVPVPTQGPVRLYSALQTLANNAVFRDPLGLGGPLLVREAKKFQPDIVLVTTPDALSPKVVKALRVRPQTKVMGVFSDALVNLGRGYIFVADYDALFFKDRYIVDVFRTKLGLGHAYYLPQACDPALHRTLPLTEGERAQYGCDVTVAGNLHYYRLARYAALADFDVKLWGAPPSAWIEHPMLRRYQGRAVIADEKCKAMLGAAIVLNDNHYAEIAGTNKRTFEIAGIGAFQLTDTPALADVFEPDVEVAQFESLSELQQKIRHYLANPELRVSMAARAQARAYREHTYAHRWVAKLAVVGQEPPPSFAIQRSDVMVAART